MSTPPAKTPRQKKPKKQAGTTQGQQTQPAAVPTNMTQDTMPAASHYHKDPSRPQRQDATHANPQAVHGTPKRTPRRAGPPVYDGYFSEGSIRNIPPHSKSTAENAYHSSSGGGPLGANAAAATPAKQAYAGPVFLASPAASALPMPKAFSKSTNSPSPHAESRTTSNEAMQTPARRAISVSEPFKREESPLDMLFNAHRAELTRSTSATQESVSPLQSGESNPRSYAPRSRPVPPSGLDASARPTPSKNKQMFLSEMDGTTDRQSDAAALMRGPSFHARIEAARRPSNNRSASTQERDELWRQAQTQRLKEQLRLTPLPHTETFPAVFSPTDPSSPAQAHRPDTGSQNHMAPSSSAVASSQGPPGTPSGHLPPSKMQDSQQLTYHKAESAPALNRPNTGTQERPDVQEMEMNLRKMLKLGP